MIQTYTVKELEDLSGLTRRTIGDYVSKGLLAGPSHRGRGACYSQTDVDILRVIPRLRVLMKKDFPTLRALRNFLAQLSSRDLHSLARKTNADAFALAVKALRLRLLLTAMLPQVSATRIEKALAALSPEQIRSIDGGRSQLGSVIDMSELLNGGGDDADDGYAATHASVDTVAINGNGHRHTKVNGNGNGNGNGYRHDNRIAAPHGTESPVSGGELNTSWSVSWLQGQPNAHSAESLHDDRSIDDTGNFHTLIAEAPHSNTGAADDFIAGKSESNSDRLSDISRRLERLERLLTTE